jgi:hypothetical protein
MDLQLKRDTMLKNLDENYKKIQYSNATQAAEYYHTLVHQLVLRASEATLAEIEQAAINAQALQQ